MNNVTIIGNITKDLEIRLTSDSRPVLSFCVAVSAGGDKADFIDCVAWGDKAQKIQQNFKKGDKIGISGMIKTRMYEQDGKNRKATEVTVLGFDFCNGRKPEQSPEETPEEQPEPVATSKAESEAPEMEYNPATGEIMIEGGEKPEKQQPSGELPFEI